MEAKLKIEDYYCYNKSFFLHQRKEESRDAVVPDTQPDIADVLFCGAKVLIRSKDVSVGRVRTEALVNADVLYRGEDGRLWSVEVDVPVFFSAEDERIGQDSLALAKLSLVGAEARVLNPRKILLRAEVEAEISVYDKGHISICESVADDEVIRSRCACRDVSLISAVTEKTFALTDEFTLPPAAEGAKGIMCLGLEPCVEEAKAVGTKLIIKGKVKSRLVFINGEGELCHLEPTTDFSQIVELGDERTGGVSLVWLTPSGVYCSLSNENEGRVCLEYHMVAQLLCCSDMSIQYVDEAYSNCFELAANRAELCLEKLSEQGRIRESVRQLYESSRSVGEVLYSHVHPGKATFEKGKMLLPYNLSAICTGADGIWCEKRKGEISFRIPDDEGEYMIKSAEIADWALLPVPGGVELRMEAAAELLCRRDERLCYVSSISYEVDKPLDNSGKPSLVLLRLRGEDELWNIARENCSCVEAILSANCIEEPSEAVGKLILIPKTN